MPVGARMLRYLRVVRCFESLPRDRQARIQAIAQQEKPATKTLVAGFGLPDVPFKAATVFMALGYGFPDVHPIVWPVSRLDAHSSSWKLCVQQKPQQTRPTNHDHS